MYQHTGNRAICKRKPPLMNPATKEQRGLPAEINVQEFSARLGQRDQIHLNRCDLSVYLAMVCQDKTVSNVSPDSHCLRANSCQQGPYRVDQLVRKRAFSPLSSLQISEFRCMLFHNAAQKLSTKELRAGLAVRPNTCLDTA